MLKLALLKSTRITAIVMAYLLIFGGLILLFSEPQHKFILLQLVAGLIAFLLGLLSASTAAELKEKIANARKAVYVKNLKAALNEAAKSERRIKSKAMDQFMAENPQYRF